MSIHWFFVVLRLTALLAAIDLARAGETTWTTLAPTPVGQAGHLLWHAKGGLFTAGGTYWEGGQRRLIASAWRLRENEAFWQNAGTLPAPKAYMAWGELAGRLHIFGGLTEQGVVADCAVAQLEPNGTLRWEPFLSLPEPRSGGAGAFVGSRFYFIGGVSAWGDPGTATDAMVSRDCAVASSAWRSEPAFPGGPRFLQVAATLKGSVYLFGGATIGTASGLHTLGDAWRFHSGAGKWERIQDLPAPMRSIAAVVAEERYVVLIGGASDEASRPRSTEIWVFDGVTGRYHRGPDLPLALSHLRAVLVDRHLIIAGGEPPGQARSSRVIRIPLSAIIPATAE